MGPNSFQSSFIPKSNGRESVDQVFQTKKSSFFGAFIVFFFVIVLLITLGLFGYKRMTRNAIESLKSELTLAEAAIDTETIDTMFVFSNKLSMAREMVMKHRVVSNFLTLLSRNIVQSVAFNDFSYEFTPDGQLNVTLKGKASNYASIALQDKILSEQRAVKSTKFGDLTLIEGGRISFSIAILVDPASAIYDPDELSVVSETGTTTIEEDLNNLQ